MKKTIIWFVISAAFIGPGTVTTATSAGANHGMALLWTIVFAVIACIILQEGAARINIVSGLSLGQAIVLQFSKKGKTSYIAFAISIAIVLGCAAYEAGNVLGAVSGISLGYGIRTELATILIIGFAGILLFTNRFTLITNFLAGIISIMGLGLLLVVFTLDINYVELGKGLLVPSIPVGSELLTLGLIGTTVVPYNLFLGSQIAKAQELKNMRFGITLSVIIGGLISISLILIGSKVQGEFSFSNVAKTLSDLTGSWAIYLFAFGLFAAGITSAITAPWAAALTVTSTIKVKHHDKAFRATWLIVLITGLVFGLSGVKPIPIIILAQALNGILLPFLAIAILLTLNNKSLLQDHINTFKGNLMLLIIVWITGVLGLINLTKAIFATINAESSISTQTLLILSIISLGITALVAFLIKAKTQ